MMMNLILIRHGYMPVILHSIDRRSTTRACGSRDAVRAVVTDAMDNSLDNAMKFLVPGWNEMSRKRASSE